MTTLDLDSFELKSGGHQSREDGMCLMEAVAWFNNEPHSASPLCVSPALTRFGIELNDRMPDAQRQKLKPLIPKLVGTRNGALEVRRSEFLVDRTLRTLVPFALRSMAAALDEAKVDGGSDLLASAVALEACPAYRHDDGAVRLAYAGAAGQLATALKKVGARAVSRARALAVSRARALSLALALDLALDLDLALSLALALDLALDLDLARALAVSRAVSRALAEDLDLAIEIFAEAISISEVAQAPVEAQPA